MRMLSPHLTVNLLSIEAVYNSFSFPPTFPFTLNPAPGSIGLPMENSTVPCKPTTSQTQFEK